MLQLVQAYRYEFFSNSPLRKFLLSKVVQDDNLSNSFNWHSKLEAENEENGEMQPYFMDLFTDFKEKLAVESPQITESIERQLEFRKRLLDLAIAIKENKKEKQVQKNDNLKKFVARSGIMDMTHFEPPFPMPIEPTKVFVRGIEPSKCFVFKSAMFPLKLSFYYQNSEDISVNIVAKKKD